MVYAERSPLTNNASEEEDVTALFNFDREALVLRVVLLNMSPYFMFTTFYVLCLRRYRTGNIINDARQHVLYITAELYPCSLCNRTKLTK